MMDFYLAERSDRQSVKMLCLLSALAFSQDLLDLPILRRIAEDNKWPPLSIYTYPKDNLPKTKAPTNPRYEIETSFPDLVKKSPLNQENPAEADLYLIQSPLSEATFEEFSNTLNTLKDDPRYDAYNGANYIFMHAKAVEEKTTVNEKNIVAHPGHFFTSGFAIQGSPNMAWNYAKNVIFPLKPVTNKVESGTGKKIQIAVDGSLSTCKESKAAIRKKIIEYAKSQPTYVIANTPSEMAKLMEESAFSIVTACETDIAEQFYDAVNALSVPIVMNDMMRFPFESELIDYTEFVVHLNETEPEKTAEVIAKLEPHLQTIQSHMIDARKMYEYTSAAGGYIWATAWSLYMKLLAWLPVRRTKIIDNIFSEPNVFVAR